jgi:type II secretory pathway predicted ATPase ExeA
MYESFFGLSRRPFSVYPDPSNLFPLPSQEQIVSALRDCVEHVDGIGMLVGEAGLGKTLLCRVLIQELEPVLQGVLLAHSNLPSKRALLQAILFELRQPYGGMDEQEARLALMNYLQARPKPSLLLVVDEAHGLAPELLEELRLLTNWTVGLKPLIHLVLAGQPLLEELLTGPEADLLNQRIARRGYLSPLSDEETACYVDHRLRWAGAEPGSIFTAEALAAIHRATDGVPRSINLLCDQVLLMASERRIAPVTLAVVKEAWGELQQLPASWDYAGTSSDASNESTPGVVEFGAPDEAIGEPAEEDSPTEALGLCEDVDDFEQLDNLVDEPATTPSEWIHDSDVFPSLDGSGEAALTEPEDDVYLAEADNRSAGVGAAPGEQLSETVSHQTAALREPPREGDGADESGALEQLLGDTDWPVVASADDPLFKQQPSAACLPLAEEQGEDLEPSPLDASFDEEEQLWDQYASLDAQSSPVPDWDLLPALPLPSHPLAGKTSNGAAAAKGTNQPVGRTDPPAAPGERTSLDCRRLFSTLRK